MTTKPTLLEAANQALPVLKDATRFMSKKARDGHAKAYSDLLSAVAAAPRPAPSNPAERCEASLCMQTNRCSYSPCRSGGNPEPTQPQQGPTDEQVTALAWRIGMGPAIVAGSDVVGFARAVLALKGGAL